MTCGVVLPSGRVGCEATSEALAERAVYLGHTTSLHWRHMLRALISHVWSQKLFCEMCWRAWARLPQVLPSVLEPEIPDEKWPLVTILQLVKQLRSDSVVYWRSYWRTQRADPTKPKPVMTKLWRDGFLAIISLLRASAGERPVQGDNKVVPLLSLAKRRATAFPRDDMREFVLNHIKRHRGVWRGNIETTLFRPGAVPAKLRDELMPYTAYTMWYMIARRVGLSRDIIRRVWEYVTEPYKKRVTSSDGSGNSHVEVRLVPRIAARKRDRAVVDLDLLRRADSETTARDP